LTRRSGDAVRAGFCWKKPKEEVKKGVRARSVGKESFSVTGIPVFQGGTGRALVRGDNLRGENSRRKVPPKGEKKGNRRDREPAGPQLGERFVPLARSQFEQQ